MIFIVDKNEFIEEARIICKFESLRVNLERYLIVNFWNLEI